MGKIKVKNNSNLNYTKTCAGITRNITKEILWRDKLFDPNMALLQRTSLLICDIHEPLARWTSLFIIREAKGKKYKVKGLFEKKTHYVIFTSYIICKKCHWI